MSISTGLIFDSCCEKVTQIIIIGVFVAEFECLLTQVREPTAAETIRVKFQIFWKIFTSVSFTTTMRTGFLWCLVFYKLC